MIDIYAVGPVSMSLCAPKDMSRDEIERQANMQNPTGIYSPWKIADSKTFADGTEMPAVCELNKSRLHWLLHC